MHIEGILVINTIQLVLETNFKLLLWNKKKKEEVRYQAPTEESWRK